MSQWGDVSRALTGGGTAAPLEPRRAATGWERVSAVMTGRTGTPEGTRTGGDGDIEEFAKRHADTPVVKEWERIRTARGHGLPVTPESERNAEWAVRSAMRSYGTMQEPAPPTFGENFAGGFGAAVQRGAPRIARALGVDDLGPREGFGGMLGQVAGGIVSTLVPGPETALGAAVGGVAGGVVARLARVAPDSTPTTRTPDTSTTPVQEIPRVQEAAPIAETTQTKAEGVREPVPGSAKVEAARATPEADVPAGAVERIDVADDAVPTPGRDVDRLEGVGVKADVVQEAPPVRGSVAKPREVWERTREDFVSADRGKSIDNYNSAEFPQAQGSKAYIDGEVWHVGEEKSPRLGPKGEDREPRLWGTSDTRKGAMGGPAIKTFSVSEWHRGVVEQAIREGRPVPARVRAEYPELEAVPAKSIAVGDRVTLPDYTGAPGSGRNYGNIKDAEVVRVAPKSIVVRVPNAPEFVGTMGPTREVRIPRDVVEKSMPAPKGAENPPVPPPSAAEVASVEPPPERLTSARKDWIERDREIIGNDVLPSPEVRTQRMALAEARARGYNDKNAAQRMAAEVNAKPRPLDDIETAGLVDAMVTLKNEHADTVAKITDATDPGESASLAATASRIEDEFDALTTAVRRSGTEKGRALASQKITLDADYSLVAVKARARAAKGGKQLTAKESAALTDATAKLDAATKRVADLEKQVADGVADRAVKRHKAGRKTPASDTEVATLLAKAKAMLKQGC